MTQRTAKKAPSLARAIRELWQTLAKDLFDAYRPEQHYMRGPGPKWQAKHATITVSFHRTHRRPA